MAVWILVSNNIFLQQRLGPVTLNAALAAVLSSHSEIPAENMVLSLLLGLSAIGTSIVNDFKSVKGDTEMGLSSIPVMYGELGAKWTTVAMTNLPQLAAAWYLLEARGQPVRAPTSNFFRIQPAMQDSLLSPWLLS